MNDDYEITFQNECGGSVSIKPAWPFTTGMVFLTLIGEPNLKARTVVHIDRLAEAVEKIKNGGGLG